MEPKETTTIAVSHEAVFITTNDGNGICLTPEAAEKLRAELFNMLVIQKTLPDANPELDAVYHLLNANVDPKRLPLLRPLDFRILKFIHYYKSKHNMSPTFREILGGVDISGMQTLRKSLYRLQNIGAITRKEGGHRAIGVR